MGAWGTGIHQNDVSEDLKDFYIGCLKAGKTDEEALADTLADFDAEISDDEDAIDVYISLADIMWKKGRLTDDIKRHALDMIERERDFGRFDEKSLKKRIAILDKFKDQLESEMPARKKIAIHKPYDSGMKEGEVYYYKVPEFKEDFYVKYNIYAGKYIILYVLKMFKKDWQVKGIYDDCSDILAGICDQEPQCVGDVVDVINSNVIFELLETTKKSRPKDMKYLGNIQKSAITDMCYDGVCRELLFRLDNEIANSNILSDLNGYLTTDMNIGDIYYFSIFKNMYYTEKKYESYYGQYIVFYVTDIKKRWDLHRHYEYPIVHMYLSNNKPQSLDEVLVKIDKKTSVEIIGRIPENRPTDLTYLGNVVGECIEDIKTRKDATNMCVRINEDFGEWRLGNILDYIIECDKK